MEQHFHTPLTVDECLERITQLSVRSWLDERATPAPKVVARIRSRKIRLLGVRSSWLRNSFRRFFYARLIDVPAGTEIVGRFRMHPFVRAFLLVWFTGIGIGCLVTLATLVSLITGNALDAKRFAALIGPPLILAVGLAIVRIGLALSAADERLVLEYLQRELKAREG